MLAHSIELAPGALVGGTYRVTRRIASGGIGEVWTATHVHSQRQVVLKRLLPDAEQEPHIVQLFEQEAALLGRIYSDFVAQRIEFLRHPIYGRVLVEDFVEGEPLAQVLRHQRFSVEQARELGFNLLRALVALERVGVVHCDLKPANIILKPLGGGRRRPMIIDFGAARVVEHAGTTLDGELAVGTPEYMAPERFSQREISAATDLYSVGVILYRAVTGKRPFREDSDDELIRAKLTREAPPLLTGRTDWTARQLEAVVARALRRDVDQRYQHADDMLTDLLALPRQACA